MMPELPGGLILQWAVELKLPEGSHLQWNYTTNLFVGGDRPSAEEL